jgi:shikimate kinase
MKIYLVGMPGCGKTRIGKVLAGEMDLPFFDLDDEIIAETGKQINLLFVEDGEEYFRLKEKELLLKISGENDHFVLSTGGGAPCYHGNMDFMNENGITVFLNVSVHQIYDKLNRRGTKTRPLLKQYDDEALLTELNAKFVNRIEFYKKAKIVIDKGFESTLDSRIKEIRERISKSEE